MGVLHKDLKPANLLIEPEPLTVKLADFGSGGVVDPGRLSQLGITHMGFTRSVFESSGHGTVLYLAPEVIRGQPWTSRADVYALGLILYQLVVDELLRHDISVAAAGNPDLRFSDAAALARGLRSLETRRAQIREQARLAERARAQQKQIERYRYRRWWTWSMTLLLTLAAIYGVFMETDYGKALFFTYDELWDAADRQEGAGNVREAERLLRHIVAMEENRVTMRFGLFVLFAGPDYLVRARLRLAQLHWSAGRLEDADQAFRDALADVIDIDGPEAPTYPRAEFHYAEFLAGTGRTDEARRHLALARRSADLIANRSYWPWQDYEASHQPAVRRLAGRIAALSREVDRDAPSTNR